MGKEFTGKAFLSKPEKIIFKVLFVAFENLAAIYIYYNYNDSVLLYY